ncbi:MAG: hypothetical protein IT467_08280 [Dokdonella sp.]|uniref:C25 family cysteine peptidase n=1 Tax=Dokdonella sp. TaxID=2291710 RepID=UPI0025C5477D|nr:C25 family cysteine peptidase [Dokdonella sp.]MBZ0222004.1 hypothetical protein [Dokdonella sp.]MCC7255913.1 hypothetical protein [Dokdonella sp.]
MPTRFACRVLAFACLALPLPALACSGRLHIEVERDGVYALDHAAIIAAQPGLADCRADELMLSERGKEVPIRVVTNGERFAEGDRIEWLGRQLHGPESWFDPYSRYNVYLLGAAKGTRARLRDLQAPTNTGTAAQRRLHLEQDNLMIRLDQEQQQPGEEPDVWMWAKLTHVDPKPFEMSFDLPDLDARGKDVTLRMNLRGLSQVTGTPKGQDKPDDHVVEITLNGRTLDALHWNGRDEETRTLTLPLAALKAKDNQLVLQVPKRALPWNAQLQAVDVVMFNWLDAQFPIKGDLDAAALPLNLRGAGDAALVLDWHAAEPALLGSDGVRRPGHALGGGRFAFAPAAPAVELYPASSANLIAVHALRAVQGDAWRAPKQGYDYLIVSHPSLIEAIRPLAQFHEQRGLSVAILDINEVYDQFNDGITHPQAIRNLVDAAWHQWPKPPRFLLLVGDASFDIRHDTYNDLAYAKWTDRELLFPGHFGAVAGGKYAEQPKQLADRNLIPTWQFPSAEGQSASDNWYGAVEPGDWHPVVAVARLPVVKPEEVKAIVDKTIDYVSRPQLGAWRRDVMFIADEVTQFHRASDAIAATLAGEGFVADKVYAKPDITENAVHQRAIHDGIDEGRLLVHFIGHGGRYIWRTGPPDLRKNNDLFTLDDVSKLDNATHLPMVLSMTCYSAPFDNPTEDSIGERFLREPGKGAIAVFAASWRNSPTTTYSKAVISNLLQPGATIGEALVRAKRETDDRTLVEMYNLLGDPAIVLERPRDEATVVFDDARWSPGVLVDLRAPRFAGNLTIDWLDREGAKLARNDYHVDDARFRLPMPAALVGKAVEARIYAASPTTGRDATGRAVLPEKRPPSTWERLLAWWQGLRFKPYERHAPAADTIVLIDFDGPPQYGAQHEPAKAPAAKPQETAKPH